MTFLAPWALVAGVLAAGSAVLLHLVARQRPAAYLLPTARFIPDRRTLVSRVTTRPRDLLLLALRMLLLLSAAAAFARPVLAPALASRARIVLLDRSRVVADAAAAVAVARALLPGDVPSRLITFDSGAALADDAIHILDSLTRDTTRAIAAGSLTAALVAARRAAPLVAGQADSVELVLVSPLAAHELDAATDSVRARWPGRITLARLPARADTWAEWTLERAPRADDPLAPALLRVRVHASPTSVRAIRSAVDARDSAFARGGGTLVRWDSVDVTTVRPAALAVGDDVVVAMLARGALPAHGRTIARWGDGSPAAIEEPLGAGCVRRVAVGVPVAGDLPLRPAFQRVVRGLLSPCGEGASGTLADSATMARLTGTGALAAGEALRGRERRSSPLAPWLLGLALACGLAELGVRARRTPESA